MEEGPIRMCASLVCVSVVLSLYVGRMRSFFLLGEEHAMCTTLCVPRANTYHVQNTCHVTSRIPFPTVGNGQVINPASIHNNYIFHGGLCLLI